MNIKITDEKSFKKELTNAIYELNAGNSISINYNGDKQIVCSSKGKTLFKIENVDRSFALEVQLFLEDKRFHFNRYEISPYAYEAVYKKPRPATR